MNIALGIDAVDIARFHHWHTYSQKTLQRIYSVSEIAYCLAIPAKSAERFAARFAAKEALFKGLNQVLTQTPTLAALCKHSYIASTNHGPVFIIDWQALGLPSSYHTRVSITHTTHTAFVAVILNEIPLSEKRT